MPEFALIFRLRVREYLRAAVLAAAIASVGMFTADPSAADSKGESKGGPKNDRATRLLATVPIPTTASNTTNGMYVFDISWVDQASRTYYLADRSNAVVDIVDTQTNALLLQLTGGFKGFTGTNGTSGPNGVVTSGHCLFVTDAPSRVVSFDTSTFPPSFIGAVTTAAKDDNRADELAFDPADGILFVINNADNPPFGTLITVDQSTCIMTQPTAPAAGVAAPDRVIFTKVNGVDAQNGAEQPQWDPDTGKFYLSIPQIGIDPSSGGVMRISTKGKIEKTFPIMFCQPAGLTKGPNNDFLVGCNTVFDTQAGLWSATDPLTAAPVQVVLNVRTGDVDQIGGVGVGDEVWYNKGDNNYYTASSTSPLRPLDITPAPPTPPLTAQGAAILGVIDAKDKEVLQLVPTFNVPAVTTGSNQHAASTAHSVAVDSHNNHVFVPLGANNVYPSCTTGCIAVYWHGDEDRPGEVALP
jgi:hypothetical protein